MFEFQLSKHFRLKKIPARSKQEIEPQEILLDRLAREKNSQNRLEVPLAQKNIKFFFFLFLFSFLFLLFESFRLQILEEDQFLKLAQANYERSYFTREARGVIYDRSLNQLVFNEISFDLVAERHDLPFEAEKREQILHEIVAILGEDFEFWQKKIEESEINSILVAENLSREQLILLQTKMGELPGFALEENVKRAYFEGPLFSHLIGYLGRVEHEDLQVSDYYSITDYLGKAGLEKTYEDALRPRKGRSQVKKDAWGREISAEVISKAGPGKSLVLWLDLDLQRKITQALQDALKKAGAQAGAVVALDPQTGGVLALVSWPSFDNNLFFEKISPEEWKEISKDTFNPFWNRVISATYPTGSTIKPLIAAAGLEEKIISPEKQIFCQGQIEVPNPWFPDKPWIFRDWKVHGWTNMKKAIAESSNVYFYILGGGYQDFKGLGKERIKQYLELFGWGAPTGIDLPGEKKGLIPDSEWKKERFENAQEQIWLPGDTYNLSIGQGYLLVSPLQVATSFVPIANRGRLLKPRVVQKIIEGSRDSFRVIEEFEPVVIRENFIEPENLEMVREGMREAVRYGSSVMLNNLPIRAAAKTGTAQTSREGYFHNWVTVFAPYENPEIVLTVMIENVPEEQVAALPVAREVLDWYFTR